MKLTRLMNRDIGMPSLRNLRRILSRRIVLEYLLALSSILLHFIYNSAVFSTLSTPLYSTMHTLFQTSFWPGHLSMTPNMVTILLESHVWINYNPHNLLCRNDNQRLSSSGAARFCIESVEYIGCFYVYWYITKLFYCNQFSAGQLSWEWAVYLSCLPDILVDIPIVIGLRLSFPRKELDNKRHYDRLLSQQAYWAELQIFSLVVMIVVVLCNLMKIFSMGLTAWKLFRTPLLTLGDSIASFLDIPDLNTANNCLFDQQIPFS